MCAAIAQPRMVTNPLPPKVYKNLTYHRSPSEIQSREMSNSISLSILATSPTRKRNSPEFVVRADVRIQAFAQHPECTGSGGRGFVTIRGCAKAAHIIGATCPCVISGGVLDISLHYIPASRTLRMMRERLYTHVCAKDEFGTVLSSGRRSRWYGKEYTVRHLPALFLWINYTDQ